MTHRSLGELLQLTAAEVDRALIPSSVWRCAGQIAPVLPDVVSVAGFEARLGRGDERVDFHVCIQGDAGRQGVADWLRRIGKRLAERHEGWQATIDFLRHWADRTTRSHNDVAAVWLEFDLHAGRDDMPVPFAIATLLPRWQRDDTWSRERDEAVVRDLVPSLSSPPGVSPQARAAVRRCIQELPPSACVAHVAVPARGRSQLVRLILNLPWRSLPSYLERIGWGALDDRLNLLLRRLCAGTILHAFHIDVGERFGNRLGCEIYFPASPRVDPRWRAVLDLLEELGICTAQRRNLAEHWWTPGRSSDGRAAPVARDLLIKVDHAAGALSAKAYLPFHHPPQS